MASNVAEASAAPIKSAFLRRHPLAIVVVLTIASYMEMLDAGIANVSLPIIAGNLGVTTEEASAVASSYLLATAVVVPITGWLSTYFGRKRLYITCVGTFVFASFLCGISTNFEMLVIARVLQGLGGGCLVAIEQAYIADSVPAEHRGMAFSIYAATLTSAPIFAPALGGWITDNYGWHWIFFINIPVGLVAIFLVSTLLEEPKSVAQEREKLRKSGRGIDWQGMLLITIGVAALTVVLEKGNEKSWFDSTFIVAFSAVALASLIFGFAWEWTHENPAVDIRLLMNRTIGGGTIVVFIVTMTIYGNMILMPMFTQRLLGYSAQDSGMINTVSGSVSIFMIPIAGFILKRVDARYLSLFGLALTALSIWYLSRLSLNAGYWDLALLRGMQAFAGAFLTSPIMTTIFKGVPGGKSDNASALVTTTAGLGGSFGIAIVTLLLTNYNHYHTTSLSRHASAYNPNYVEWISNTTNSLREKGLSAIEAAQVAQAQFWEELGRQSLMLAFNDVYQTIMILVICAMPIIFLLKTRDK